MNAMLDKPNPRAEIGGNDPPVGVDHLAERLREAHLDLLKRQAELLDGATRAPVVIESEEVAEQATDFIKQVQICAKNLEAARVKEKEPFLDASRRVDGFFKTAADPLARVKAEIERRLTLYQRRKADEERQRREEAERMAREEAAARAREAAEAAARLEREAELPAAIKAERDARDAQADAERLGRIATSKPADMSRTRTQQGTVASLTQFWTFADLDRESIDLEKLRGHIPLAALEQAVGSFVRAGGRDLKGVRIFEDTKSVVR